MAVLLNASRSSSTYDMHGEHGVHLDETRMKVAKEGNEQYVLQILRITCKVAHVFYHSAQEYYPQGEKESTDLLYIVFHVNSDLPKQPEHGSVV